MKVPLWRMTKSDLISVTDSIDTPTQFITLFNDAHTQKCTVRGWRLHFNNIFLLCPRTILSSWSQWSQTYPGLQGLGWELYNRTAGNESTPMKNDKIRFNSVTDSIDTPTQFITFHDAHTQKCTVQGWRLHFNNIFLLCPRTILSSWSQWSQTISWFAGSWLGTIQQDNREWKYPYEKWRNQINSVTDSIDIPTQFITFHDAHTHTKVHCSGMASTLNNIFLLCPRTILSSWSQWSQTYPGLQGLGWELYNRTAGDESTPMKNNDIRYNSVTDSIDTQFITFHRRSNISWVLHHFHCMTDRQVDGWTVI